MRSVNIAALLAIFTLVLSGCFSQPAQSTLPSTTANSGITVESETITPSPTSALPIVDSRGVPSYSVQYSSGEYLYDIRSFGEGKLRDVATSISKGGTEVYSGMTTITGAVTVAQIADLDTDGNTEIYVFTQDFASGNTASVVGSTLDSRNRVAPISIASMTGTIAEGYRGYDSFTIEDSRMFRAYPIYKEGDSLVNPSGGERTIAYRLAKTASGMTLVSNDWVKYPNAGIGKFVILSSGTYESSSEKLTLKSDFSYVLTRNGETVAGGWTPLLDEKAIELDNARGKYVKDEAGNLVGDETLVKVVEKK